MTWKVLLGSLGLLLGAALAGTPLLGARNGSSGTHVSQEPAAEPTQAEQRRAAQLERVRREQEAARAARDARCVQTLRDMQGGWQLVAFRSPLLQDEGRQEVAYLLVGGEFLSIEIHMAYFDQAGVEERSFIQTGTYRLNFNTDEDLTAMLLIGTLKSEEGYTVPQFPGDISVYGVEFSKGSLILTRDDGTRFTFERVGSGALTELLYREVEWLPGSADREARRAAEASAAELRGEEEP
jgi:hypothetical protein